MSDPDLSWMNNLDGTLRPEFGGAQYPVDLSWMNNLDGMLRPEFSGTPYPAAPAPVPNDADKNALAYLTKFLDTYGLGSRGSKAWDYIVANGATDPDRMMIWLYDQPEFKTRFPALAELQAKGRAITPAQYINLEQTYTQTLRAAGYVGNYFNNPEDFHSLIGNEVSPAEFQARINDGYAKVAGADPQVRDAFKQYFGVEGDTALAAFFIDPERSKDQLLKAAQTAEIGAAAKQSSFNLNSDYASKLAGMGVSYSQALSGFNKMVADKSLFERSAGETQITASGVGGGVDLSTAGTVDGLNHPNVATDTSTTDNSSMLAADYAFGTDPQVKKELETRLAMRMAQASGTKEVVSVDKVGKTGVGIEDR
jgi:hypothetical protein